MIQTRIVDTPIQKWNWKPIAHVAQLAEHVLGKDEVVGSIPIVGLNRCNESLAKGKNKTQNITQLRRLWQKKHFKEVNHMSMLGP